MTGDYTKVALRASERWETAPVQQGRALLDHELNLGYDASVRRDRRLARDAIGAAGVVEGSTAFQIGVTGAGAVDLTVGAGHFWVDGLAAFAPGPFSYSDQDEIAALPASGRALVHLDVWQEHLQPAENLAIVDPALAPIDTAARTRVGYRVRVAPTTATTCASAWAGFAPARLSTGTLSAVRVGPAVTPDPCDPPGDAQGLLPDSLLRIEVFDQGTAAGARFAWSYEDGAAAVAVANIAGDTVTLQPSAAVKFGTDLVEVSWLARRADRLNAGSLYTVIDVVSSAGGDVLTLDRAVTAPPGAEGLVVRRWDGEVIGAATPQNATRDGNDLGVRFNVSGGTYRPGDWWGVRVREADGIEALTDAPPDGTAHAFAPLALIDLGARAVISDCRPTFRPLTEIETGSACTVVVRPGDGLQAAVDALPVGGGEVCIAAGDFPVAAPVQVRNRANVRIVGVGPATIVRSTTGETVFQFIDSDDVEVEHLAVRTVSAGPPPGEESLNGAITFEGCRGVTVRSVHANIPDAPVRTQTAVTVRERGTRVPERVTISGNRLVVGSWQVGVLVANGRDVTIDHNHVSLGAAPDDEHVLFPGRSIFVDELTRLFVASTGSPSPTTRPAPLPTGRTVNLVARSPIVPIVDEWVSAGAVTADDDRLAFHSFAATITADRGASLSVAGRASLVALARSLRAVGQGIVVGGQRASTVAITDNAVRDAVQGIHVGVSRAGIGTRESIDEVLIARNTVHLAVATTYGRDRHAVFVGNVQSAEIVDTRATLTRPLGTPGVVPTPVDGVRVVGFLGPFVVVRGGSFAGFNIGVRAEPLGTVPTQRVWSISEVNAGGLAGAVGAVAPLSFTRTLVTP